VGTTTSIEWADETANPIRPQDGGWWCHPSSPGCDHCYAEALNQWRGNKRPYGGVAPPLELDRDLLASWARKRKPRRIFISSMTDIFGVWVPETWVFEILDAMAAAGRMTFLPLTKWVVRMRCLVAQWLELRGLDELPPHIWPCCSVENQIFANQRIPELLQIPAMCHGLSIEPLIGPIELARSWIELELQSFGGNGGRCFPRVDFVMVGGESGDETQRPMHPLWAESLRDQCLEHQVRYLFKQWGAWEPLGSCWQWHELHAVFPTRDLIGIDQYGYVFQGRDKGHWYVQDRCQGGPEWFRRVGKVSAGRVLGGREWNQILVWDPDQQEVVPRG